MTYAFHIFENSECDEIAVVVTDLEHFQREGFASDWSLHDLMVPDFMQEASEGLYLSSQGVGETRAKLLALGAVEDAGFTAFIKTLND